MAGSFFSRLFGCFANGSGSDDNPITSIQRHQGNRKYNNQWEKKLARHLYGQYSMALVQANIRNEDRFQLESGPLSNVPNGPTGVFVGIYDGHGGETCSQFILDHLFNDLKNIITHHHSQVSPYVIQQAYLRTENNFMGFVRRNWERKPKLATVGSCCLTGVVHGNVLYVANAGDSRAVLARWADGDEQPVVHQLSIDHNANNADRREELQLEQHDDPVLFSYVHGSFRVRGRLQVTRAIGDAYLKSNEFNRPPLEARYRQQQPIVRPILKSEPTILTYDLEADDKFVIFGSDGLWEEVTNEEAVSVVKASPRSGAAGALLKEALVKASHKHNMQYQQLIDLPLFNKRSHHDDISIVILFFDHLPARASNSPNIGC
ncbi:Protein phosphatase 2C [Rhynchospora pubera]|uniref:protein-serine/threonine phosphatase n=1 Tax=Rhynchospora pubera TaxID=906938 RepID=A0AAV8DTF6_9POAL|nr:Protein phosphatase 2C [Rhynchospora pubera]